MIKGQYKRFYDRFYCWYAKIMVRRHFSNFIVDVPKISQSRPLLVLSNHHTWWDGFWVLLVNKRFLKKRFHVMMLDEQLKKHPTFAHIGAFGIAKGRRQVLESLDYTVGLLSSSDNMVLVFPQGKLHSQHIEQMEFGKGIGYVLKNQPDIDVLMLVSFTDYFEHQRPEVRIYGHLIDSDAHWNDAFNAFYSQCKNKQQLLCK